MRFRLPWREWALEPLTPPWGSLPSTYQHLKTSDGRTLPDDDEVNQPGQLRWAPGAADGVMGHHSGQETSELVSTVFSEIAELLKTATNENLNRVYQTIKDNPCLSYVDNLGMMIAEKQDSLDIHRLARFAVWLCRNAPHREPVKLGLALLGGCGSERDLELITALGRHDEFTLFAAIAAGRASRDPESTLWEMAKAVKGWGRIHIVERLADTARPEIQAWMLSEGFRNEVMDEYLACICARAGRLEKALSAPFVDRPLLDGAAGILRALLAGGPAEGIADYEDAPQAIDAYVNHLWSTPDAACEHYLAARELSDYVTGNSRFTTEDQERLLATMDDILTRDSWRGKVERGLRSEDRVEFAMADEVARHLGIDTWQIHFDRVKRDGLRSHDWFSLLRESDDTRIDTVLAFAETVIPLHQVATGPAHELGLGHGWEAHSTLDWILQDLRRFPGKGWVFLKAGIASPVVRNRNMAIHAFGKWPRDEWPPDAAAVLDRAIELEPDDAVLQRLRDLRAA